ncbi:MAG: hypothetical protein MAG451_01012 [Anaerolineales bacterium]|nr:hypothetical protein [Anaerolineales bacterium]
MLASRVARNDVLSPSINSGQALTKGNVERVSRGAGWQGLVAWAAPFDTASTTLRPTQDAMWLPPERLQYFKVNYAESVVCPTR